RPAPEPECLLEQPPRLGRPARGQPFARLAGELLESVEVELALLDPQLVPRRPRDEPLRSERLPQLRDVHLQRLRRARRRRLAPELLDEPVGRDDVVPVQEQEREQRTRLRRAPPEPPAADDDVERPEKAKLVHLS